MSLNLTVTEIFKAAALTPHGPVQWRNRVFENRPGVYAVAIVPGADDNCDPIKVDYLPDVARVRWVPGQPVIYMGEPADPFLAASGNFTDISTAIRALIEVAKTCCF